MARIAMRMNNGGRIAEHFKRRVAGSVNFGGVPQSDCLRTLLHWICIFGTTFLGFSLGSADACSLDVPSLKSRLEMLVHQIDGCIGICVACTGHTISFNGNQRFSLQSVMKIAIAVAVLDRVDHGSLRLDEPMIVRKADLSVGHQPLANLIGKDGYHTTLQDLLFRMIIDSDNAATDLLFARLGGPAQCPVDSQPQKDYRLPN